MGFEDLEILLRTLFQKARKRKNVEIKKRVRFQVMEAFAHKETESVVPLFGRLFAQKSSRWAFALVSFFVLFNILPNNLGLLSAGEIKLKNGVVEVIRGNKVILVTDDLKLKKGDLVRVGNNGEAEIIFADNFSSTVKSQTKLRVVDQNSLFLETGSLENETRNEGEITTNRGFVRSLPGSSFQVLVSESGETRVISEKNQVVVSDWKDGETLLDAGDEVRLSSDTVLGYLETPHDLNLSLAQIRAVQAKMIITRTKILSGLEKILAKEKTKAEREFLSAKKSFLSIMNILDSSRDLSMTSTRKNLDLIALSDIAEKIKEKTPNSNLVVESQALETLLSLTENNVHRLGFVIEESGVKSFDRFVLLDRIFAFGTGKEQRLGYHLKQKYAIAFLQDIQDNELRIDQVSELNEQISKLPRTELAMEFLERVQDLFAPDLANMLEEKMDNVF